MRKWVREMHGLSGVLWPLIGNFISNWMSGYSIIVPRYSGIFELEHMLRPYGGGSVIVGSDNAGKGKKQMDRAYEGLDRRKIDREQGRRIVVEDYAGRESVWVSGVECTGYDLWQACCRLDHCIRLLDSRRVRGR